MLKKIFKRIEGREWDWFGEEPGDGYLGNRWITDVEDEAVIMRCVADMQFKYSLADLLANKSWCMAVWGKEEVKLKHIRQIKGMEVYQDELNTYKKLLTNAWEYCPVEAFKVLREEGEEACLKYIEETMV